jgi:hypothetical protein
MVSLHDRVDGRDEPGHDGEAGPTNLPRLGGSDVTFDFLDVGRPAEIFVCAAH